MPASLNVIARPQKSLPFEARLSEIADQLRSSDESMSIALFGLDEFDRVLKTTISLCPDCLQHVPAIVYTRGLRVLMRKICRE